LAPDLDDSDIRPKKQTKCDRPSQSSERRKSVKDQSSEEKRFGVLADSQAKHASVTKKPPPRVDSDDRVRPDKDLARQSGPGDSDSWNAPEKRVPPKKPPPKLDSDGSDSAPIPTDLARLRPHKKQIAPPPKVHHVSDSDDAPTPSIRRTPHGKTPVGFGFSDSSD
jgi:hypothetical protein